MTRNGIQNQDVVPKRMPLHIGWLILGTLPWLSTATSYLDIAFVTWPVWKGYVSGIEISIIEILAAGLLYASSSKSEQRPALPRRVDPILWLAVFYFLTVIISLFNAPAPLAGLFYCAQIIRIYIVYRIVAAAAEDRRVFDSIFAGLCAGLLIEGSMVVWQRFGGGALQPSGTFVHQNMLGLSAHYVTVPAFALALRLRSKPLLWMTVGAGAAVAILTASRATLGISAMALFLTFLLVPMENVRKKASMALVLVLGAAVLAPVGLSSLERRFQAQEQFEEYDERGAFEAAAWIILSRNPLGVGVNNFNVVANSTGAYDQAGVAAQGNSRAALVHNAYWLMAAETGYMGILSYVLLVIGVIWTTWKAQRSLPGGVDKAFVIGCFMSYVAVAVHSAFEWISFTNTPQYLWAITFGLAVAAGRRIPSIYKRKEQDTSVAA